MEAQLHIDQLIWDDWNREHIAKHDVVPAEAEEVAFSQPAVLHTYKGRFQLIGPTQSGRVLTVILGLVPNQPHTYYGFSARPASRKERQFFDDQKGASTI